MAREEAGLAWDLTAGRHALGDVALQSGETLRDAVLAWTTYGTPAPDRSDVVLFATSYSAQAAGQDWPIAPGGILDPTRWFVVVPDMFGNDASSSPSNTPGPVPPASRRPTMSGRNAAC